MSGQCKFFSQNAKTPPVANNCSILTRSLLITIVLAIALNLLLHTINSTPPQITVQLVWGRASTATRASRTPRPTSLARGTRANQQALRGCWPPAPRTSSSTTTPPSLRVSRPPTREPGELSTKWSCNWPPAPLSQMWRCAKVYLQDVLYSENGRFSAPHQSKSRAMRHCATPSLGFLASFV